MIRGIGVDIVEHGRFEKHVENERFLGKLLHAQELLYLQTSGESSAAFLASRFAAKEAFSKALGTGMRNLSFSEIEVAHDQLGAPFFRFYGSSAEVAARLGEVKVHLSLSHERSASVAFVIIEAV